MTLTLLISKLSLGQKKKSSQTIQWIAFNPQTALEDQNQTFFFFFFTKLLFGEENSAKLILSPKY